MILLEEIISHYVSFLIILLMVIGLYTVVQKSNMIKRLIGLGIFQTSVYLVYLSPGKILGATPPIIAPEYQVYSNPLPHVLILTAIVVGVATLALGLAITVRINEAFGSIEEDEVVRIVDRDDHPE
ncbi:MAG: cation:proton antiporter subunit C [Pseudomonadota bacterium]